jgi:hypothetical protein
MSRAYFTERDQEAIADAAHLYANKTRSGLGAHVAREPATDAAEMAGNVRDKLTAAKPPVSSADRDLAATKLQQLKDKLAESMRQGLQDASKSMHSSGAAWMRSDVARTAAFFVRDEAASGGRVTSDAQALLSAADAENRQRAIIQAAILDEDSETLAGAIAAAGMPLHHVIMLFDEC